ncbi:MAG: hypothetical protein ACE5G5_01825 [Candidatus Methylomirabilales bacterium]
MVNIGLLTLAVLGVGCSQGWMTGSRLAPTGLKPEDGLAVIAYEDPAGEYSEDIGEDVVECVEDALEDTHPTVRVVPLDEFHQAAFPDLTPEETPSSGWAWELLLSDAAFRERIAPLGLRYLIIVTFEEGKGPANVAAVASRGAAAIVVNWQTRASMHARIVDLIHSREAGTVQAEATAQSSAGLIGIFPFYIPSFPEGRACEDLGEGVAKLLAGESFGDQIGIWPDITDQWPEEMEPEQFEKPAGEIEEGTPPVRSLEPLDWSSTPCC